MTIDVVVFDVLGTLVDEPSGLRDAVAAAVPGMDQDTAADLARLWQAHVAGEQERIVGGGRAFVPGHVLDAEAAAVVARAAGVDDPDVVATLGDAGTRLPAWPDSADGLARLARAFPVVGLSNASRTTLLRLAAGAGLRWHQALSAQDARTYKPAPAVYRLAVDLAGAPPGRTLLVAAHAWDLRGAAAAGMRTAYLPRPGGDPPADDDCVDLHVTDMAELAATLATSRPGAHPC
ncbi:haloacid dehalogenase type II [Pseudonocardia sp. ICBG162]|uniref:haloacid dehalogenase type II n=1 Tax=Pseudonocardia sp. ICBG162 TaxID=2846761 RepID=UPI001CF6BEA2|nr:haloacid dehalogenase type II [Pseudonocardia sp. ICBG162]